MKPGERVGEDIFPDRDGHFVILGCVIVSEESALYKSAADLIHYAEYCIRMSEVELGGMPEEPQDKKNQLILDYITKNEESFKQAHLAAQATKENARKAARSSRPSARHPWRDEVLRRIQAMTDRGSPLTSNAKIEFVLNKMTQDADWNVHASPSVEAVRGWVRNC